MNPNTATEKQILTKLNELLKKFGLGISLRFDDKSMSYLYTMHSISDKIHFRCECVWSSIKSIFFFDNKYCPLHQLVFDKELTECYHESDNPYVDLNNIIRQLKAPTFDELLIKMDLLTF
jgi:hypothetical protein